MIPPGAEWLEACALRPDLIERYLDCHVHSALLAIPVAASVGVRCLWAGGDLASSKGPLYSPAMFRRFLLPRLQKITQAAHQHGLVYLFRTDGNVWSIAEDLFVNSGLDGYGEIDIVARKKDCTAFVEVRTRTGAGFGTPEESITRHKRDKMVTCALDYVARHDELRDAAWRIDVVAIELDDEGRQTRAEIIESAVPLD